jgi:ABC-type transport system substrate-binding protein
MIGVKLLERYELVEQIGHGGMGVVYRARDPLLGREVAVKMLPPGALRPDTEERFRREAKLVAQMDHPGIVPIFDFGQYLGSLFLVMPVVEGTTVRKLSERGGLHLGEVLEIGAQAAEALDYSHSRGVVHRDIKPDNLMVSLESDPMRVRLMDFGLARDTGHGKLTHSGGIVGTIAYMSPEQIQGGAVGIGADLYGLGAVLYECLAGAAPFVGPLYALVPRIVGEPPPGLRGRGALVDEELDVLVLSCLAKDPGQRPKTGRELASGLRRAAARLGGEALRRRIAAPAAVGPTSPSLPLVGRQVELQQVAARLQLVAAGEAQSLLVEGEAGLGKSRLLDEIATLCRSRGLRVVRGRLADRQSALPYQGFCELVQDGLRSRDTSLSSSGNLQELAELAGELVSRFPLLAQVDQLRSLAEPGDPSLAAGSAPPAGGPLEIAQLFARTLQKINGGHPFAILLEDLHLASESTAETLERFATFLASSPVLLVASLRPSEVEAGGKAARLLAHWRDDPRTARLRLEPLAGEDFARLVGLHLGLDEAPAELVERLFAASEGNPLFVRELIRAWCDTAELRRGETGSWTFSGSRALLSGDALPQAVKEAVERHLDRLPAAHRRLLELAAVLGPRFDFDDLVALLSETGLPGVDSTMVGALGPERLAEKLVEALLQAGVLVEERRGFLSFASLLQREVLYHRLSRRERRACHRKAAEHLLRRYAGREDKVLAAIFHHAAEGELAEATERWGLELARRQLAASQGEEAVKVARRALEGEEAGEAGGRQRGELERTLAQAERLLGDLDAAIDAAEKAFTLFDRADQPAAAAQTAYLLAETAWQSRRGELARAWVERGLEMARFAEHDDREPPPGAIAGTVLSNDGVATVAATIESLLLLGATVANLRGEHEEARHYFAELERRGRAKTADQRYQEGGTLRVAFTSAELELDPVQAASREELEVGALLYDVLIERAGEMQSPLLESAFLSADGRRCELRLRGGLAFSDGSPVAAPLVKRSLERAARGRRGRLPAALAVLDGIEAFLRGQEEEIRGLDVISERALLCELSEPLPIFPALLSDPTLALVREVADPAGNKRLFGTGPFELERALPRHLLLSRRRSPGGARSARLDHLEIELGVESTSVLAALRAGELDLGGDLPSQEIESALRDPRLRAGYVEEARQNVVFLLLRPALEAEQRRALIAAIDVFGLVQFWGRLAQPAFGLLPPGVLGHNADRRPLRFEKAPELLAGSRFRAGIHRRLMARHRALFERLAANFEAAGSLLEWQELDGAPRSDRADFDLLFIRATAASDDPDELAFGLFHSRRGRLRAWLASEELDALLEEGRLETRPLQRAEIYRRIEEELLGSELFLPLFHEIDGRVAGPQVRGLRLSPRPPFIDYGRLAKGEPAVEQGPRAARGGEIHVPLPGKPEELNPLLGLWSDFVEILPNVFETLVRVEAGARSEPWLAAGWEARGGGARYHFHLRQGVRFHDGRRFSSRDVRWSFERLLRSPRAEAHFPLLPIKGARAFRDGAAQIAGLQLLSAHEVLVELEKPIAFFPSLLSHPLTAIVPEGTHSLAGAWRDGCVGTGAFRVLRFEPQRRLELERNPDYWRPGYPKADKLIFHFGSAGEKVAADFRQGRLSLASDLPPAEIDALRRDPEFAAGYRETPRLATYFLVLDPRHPPFRSREQRRELAGALGLAAALPEAGRLAMRAHGLIPPGLLGYEAPAPLPALPPAQPLDREKVFVRVVKHPVYAGAYGAFWQKLKEGAQAAGFELDDVELQPGQATVFFREGRADLLAFRWVADYPDTDGFLANLLHSEEGAIGKVFGMPELDRAIERARCETDPGLRHVLYREIDEKLVHDLLVLPLFHEQIYRFRHPSVRGFRFGQSTPEVHYDELYLRR